MKEFPDFFYQCGYLRTMQICIVFLSLLGNLYASMHRMFVTLKFLVPVRFEFFRICFNLIVYEY
jgi:hypothetical protein